MGFKAKIEIPIERMASHDALAAAVRLGRAVAAKGVVPTRLYCETSFRQVDLSPRAEDWTGDGRSAEVEALLASLAAGQLERLISIKLEWQERGQQEWALRHSFRKDEPTDLLVLENCERQPDPKVMAVLEQIGGIYQALDWPSQRIAGLPSELREFHKAQEATFAAREAGLIRGYAELDQRLLAASKTLDTQRQALQSEFDERRKALEADLATRDKAIVGREKALADERAKLDDRTRMHARRGLQDALSTMLSQEKDVSLSNATSKKRWWIHGVCLAVFGVAGVLYWKGIARLGDDQTHALGIGMMVTGTLLFGSTLVFYLRWLDGWFSRHANAEFEVRTRRQDLHGAGWLVELLFEWYKDVQGQPFPPEMLTALCEELFVARRGHAGGTQHPVSDLAAAVGALREIEIGKGTLRLRGEGPTPTTAQQ